MRIVSLITDGWRKLEAFYHVEPSARSFNCIHVQVDFLASAWNNLKTVKDTINSFVRTQLIMTLFFLSRARYFYFLAETYLQIKKHRRESIPTEAVWNVVNSARLIAIGLHTNRSGKCSCKWPRHLPHIYWKHVRQKKLPEPFNNCVNLILITK